MTTEAVELTHIEKAVGALEAAKEVLAAAEVDEKGMLPLREHDEVSRLLNIASVQARIAQAKAMEGLLDLAKDALRFNGLYPFGDD